MPEEIRCCVHWFVDGVCSSDISEHYRSKVPIYRKSHRLPKVQVIEKHEKKNTRTGCPAINTMIIFFTYVHWFEDVRSVESVYVPASHAYCVRYDVPDGQ